MHSEIERKFLVAGDYWPFVSKSTRIVQGYLSTVPERTVRVRIAGDRGYLTIKGTGNKSGVTRFEWEREVPLREAAELLKLCEPGVIDKTRSLVPAGPHTYEVDEFHGENEGLVVAEIELAEESEAFEKPVWLGEEVSGRIEYYNAMLMKRPFTKWEKGP